MEIEDYFLVQAASTLALVEMMRNIDPSPWPEDMRAELLLVGMKMAASLARGSIPDDDEFADSLIHRSMAHFVNLGGELMKDGRPMTILDPGEHLDWEQPT
jgi:hypothetical protein